MQPLARAGRNLALKSLGETASRLCFLALFLLAAPLLGAQDFGRYAYAVSLASLVLVGMDLGLNNLMVAEVARQPQDLGRYAGTILALKLALAAAALLVLLLLAGTLGEGQALPLVLAVALSQALWGLVETAAAGLMAGGRFAQEAALKVGARGASLVLAGGLLLGGAGLWGLVAGLAVANLMGALAGPGLLRQRAAFKLDPQAAFLGGLVRRGLPLAFSGLFILFYSRIDMVLLGVLGRPYPELGWYGAATRVVDALAMIPSLLAAALLPVLAGLAPQGMPQVGRLYRQGLRLSWLLGLPAGAGLWAVRQELTQAVFGADFAPAAPCFWWLAPMLALLFVNYLQLVLLTALGKQRLLLAASASCLLLNLLLNLWWIPRQGYLGAAAVTLATEAALFLLCARFIRAAGVESRNWSLAWRPALAAAAMLACLLLLPEGGLALKVGSGLTAYALAALLLRVVSWEEMRSLPSLLRGSPEPWAQGRS